MDTSGHLSKASGSGVMDQPVLSSRETRERTRGSNVRMHVEETHTELDRDFKRTRGGLHFISLFKD